MKYEPGAFERSYSAFISYSHRDTHAAARLARRLEQYRLPRSIAQRIGFRRLKPVFRDRDELVAAPDLSEAIRQAIRQADYMIVVGSRHAAASRWVAEEIAMFRALHGDGGILVALFDKPSSDCLPPALLKRCDGQRGRPLAADFTPHGDGDRLALLKLVAVLAGVALDDLVRRDAQRQVRQVIAIAVATVAVLAVVAVVTVLAMQARAEAARERQRTQDAARYQLDDVTAKVRAGGNLRLAETVNAGVARLIGQPGAGETIESRMQRATLAQAMAETAEKRGDLATARHEAARAFAITAVSLQRAPANPTILYAHAQSAYWRGLVAWRSDDVTRAERLFTRYAGLAAQLVARNPEDPKARFEFGYANSNLGMLALRRTRNTTLARGYFMRAQSAFTAAAQRQRDTTQARYELADGEGRLATVDRLASDLSGAMRHRAIQRRLIDELIAEDPGNALYHVDLIASEIGMARIDSNAGRHLEAMQHLAAAAERAARRHEADPDDQSIVRQQRVIAMFTVQDQLEALPLGAKPDAATTALLGNCAGGWNDPAASELAAFCSLLEARVAVRRGDVTAARHTMATPRVMAAIAKPDLSPSWSLDFAALARTVQLEIGRAGKGEI